MTTSKAQKFQELVSCWESSYRKLSVKMSYEKILEIVASSEMLGANQLLENSAKREALKKAYNHA